MSRGRILVVLALVAAGGAALLVFRDAGSGPQAAQASPPPLTVSTRLPAWRALGVPLEVRGFADARARIRLRANGRRVASTLSGRFGGYRLTFPAGRPGRFVLTVADGTRSRRVGTLTVRPVVLDAVGDITFGEQVGPTLATRGARYPWTNVGPTLRRADVTTGNLETSVSTRGTPAVKQYVFRGVPSDLPPLASVAGFDVLTLANNHADDYGPQALLDTIRAVHAAGMQTIGAGANEARARRPATVDAGGLRIAFLGYSDVNPLGFNATATSPGTAKADVAAIESDVHAALRRADLAVCFFHWGVELRPDPDSRQEALAAACLDAGARLVLGAHPHVLGPLSRPSRTSLVAWTLGNFVFPASGAPAHTAILQVSLSRLGVRGYRLLPVTIEGFRPVLAG
ncbi:MAG TPA: CapA family protein [Gaiellaceae bacterium]|nr:CapA family protein [Gaiellaceae bacterium]